MGKSTCALSSHRCRESPLCALVTPFSLPESPSATLLPDTSSCGHPAGRQEWLGFKGKAPRAALPKPTPNMHPHMVPQKQLLPKFPGSKEAARQQRDDRESRGLQSGELLTVSRESQIPSFIHPTNVYCKPTKCQALGDTDLGIQL